MPEKLYKKIEYLLSKKVSEFLKFTLA